MRKLLILLAATALVVAFTLPASAEVSFYGQSRFNTGWMSVDADVAGTDTVDNVDWTHDTGNSRFGANFQDGAVGGTVEIRPLAGAQMRHWYGWWDFGGGKLIVGQTWAPTFAPVACACYEGGLTAGYGDVIGSLRAGQMALHMGSLQIAALTPSQASKFGALGSSTGMLPKIEANYSLKAGPAAIKLYGGYNSSEEEVLATKKSYDYNSYLFGANVRMAFGAAGVALNVYTAKNPVEYGMAAANAQAATITTDVNEVDVMGFLVDFNYKISPTMSFFVGFGQAQDELDVPGTSEGTHTIFYAGLPITLAKNVTITPEVGQFSDELDVGAAVTPAPSTTYYGAYWQINF
jgi:hypothetical protein